MCSDHTPRQAMAGTGEMPQIPMAYQHQSEYSTEPFRSPAHAPLRKLTVDLIKTYRKINEVRLLWMVWGALGSVDIDALVVCGGGHSPHHLVGGRMAE